MFPTFEEISTQIATTHHATVPFPMPHDELAAAMGTFFEFLKLPQETKDRIYYQVEPSNRGTEVGYKLYKRDLGNTDNREYFHYHASAEGRFAEDMARIPELARLMGAMRRIFEAAQATFKTTISLFEPRFPGIREQFFPSGAFPHFYLRFLKYDAMRPGDFLAKGHYDRGTCTLALAESAPGLRMGRDADTLHLVRHDDGQALFMPGLKFPEVASPEFPPTWHDVVQQDVDLFRDDIARWAIVFFCDHRLMKDISYEEAHTSSPAL